MSHKGLWGIYSGTSKVLVLWRGRWVETQECVMLYAAKGKVSLSKFLKELSGCLGRKGGHRLDHESCIGSR